MRSYHISELEQLSGIKAHTIRVWERRYQLIEPERTGTNIRMYDDIQVRRLLNVATLLAGGYKISVIAALSEKEMHEKVRELKEAEQPGDAMATAYVNDLVISMLDFNEAAFEKTFSASVTRYGMPEAVLNVFYPLLLRIGLMWATDKATPVQEHFASVIIRRKLLAATDGLMPPVRKNKKFLLMLPPGEWHEIGLLFADYLLRAKGFATINMGQNVPYENVAGVVAHAGVTHLLLFFIARKPAAEMAQLRKKMRLPQQVQLYVAGNAEITTPLSKEKNTTILTSPHHLLKIV